MTELVGGILDHRRAHHVDAEAALQFQSRRQDKAVQRPADHTAGGDALRRLVGEDTRRQRERSTSAEVVLADQHHVGLSEELAAHVGQQLLFVERVECVERPRRSDHDHGVDIGCLFEHRTD
jgi:hypothetical protein